MYEYRLSAASVHCTRAFHCDQTMPLQKYITRVRFSVNELLKIKEDLTKERDEQLQEIVKLREQLADASSRQQDLESNHAEANARIQEVRPAICTTILLLHSVQDTAKNTKCTLTFQVSRDRDF